MKENNPLFVYLLLVLRKQADYKLPCDDATISSLSAGMGMTSEKVKEYIDDCVGLKLLQRGKGMIWSDRLLKDMTLLTPTPQRTRREVPRKEPVVDNDFAEMVKLYEEKTGQTMTPPDVDLLKDIADHYPPDQFKKAVDEAVKSRARSPMKYIGKVLENWKKEKEVKTPVRRSYDDGDRTEGMREAN